MQKQHDAPSVGPARLQGRRALITGAASGIGLATAERLSAEGARVALVDVRGDDARAAASGVGGESIGLACDVGDELSVRAAVDATIERFQGLDIVVTCAGITRSSDTHTCALEEWDAVIRTNLTGTFLVLKHSIPHLLAGRGGAIVTVGSVASIVAASRAASYDASKGGVLQLTRAVAVEYVDGGIRANCVLPGVTRTHLAATSTALHGPMKTATSPPAASRVRIPMQRQADPSEIAGVVAFLVSDDASFITGAAIAADGGYTAV